VATIKVEERILGKCANGHEATKESITAAILCACHGVNDAGVVFHVVKIPSDRSPTWALEDKRGAKRPRMQFLLTLSVTPADSDMWPQRVICRETLRQRLADKSPLMENVHDMVIYYAALTIRYVWQTRRFRKRLTEAQNQEAKDEALKKRRYNSRDAEKFAMRKLNEHRSQTGRPEYEFIKQENPFKKHAEHRQALETVRNAGALPRHTDL